MWDFHFGRESFADKLNLLNSKIRTFRENIRSGPRVAYRAVLNVYYDTAVSNFFEDATYFATRMKFNAYIRSEHSYPLSDLGDIWHMYLTKVIFPPTLIEDFL